MATRSTRAIYKSALIIMLIAAAVFLYFKSDGFFKRGSPPSATIFMTKEGFKPSEITIRKGEAIEFVNSAPKDCPVTDASCSFWPASDMHPTHDIYPGFDPLSPIGTGDSWVFVFERLGDWGMHDHLRATNRGVVHVID